MFVLSVQNTPTGEMPPQTVRDGEDTVGLDLEGPEAPPGMLSCSVP